MINCVSFHGSETAGSIGKLKDTQTGRLAPVQTETVNFKGYDEPKKSSWFSNLVKLTATAAIVIGGLGYVHKADVVGKLKDGKFKDFLRKSDKLTEPCHKLCSRVKGYGIKTLNTVKGWFGKKA